MEQPAILAEDSSVKSKIGHPKFKNKLYRQIWANVRYRKRNAMICVVGRVGTGKSYVALRMAETLDPTFNKDTVRERVVTTPEQFMALISRSAGKLKIGSAIVIDEASTQMYNRKWQSVNNIAINFILTTFRNKRLICIFTLPYMTFLDAHVRKMFDYYVETTKIDFKKERTYAKVFELSYDKMKGSEPYKKYLRKKNPSGVYAPIKRNYFGKPSQALADAYETYAEEFKHTIQETAVALVAKEVVKEEVKEKKLSFDPQPIIDVIMKDIDKYSRGLGGKKVINVHKVMASFNISMAQAERVKFIISEKTDLSIGI